MKPEKQRFQLVKNRRSEAFGEYYRKEGLVEMSELADKLNELHPRGDVFLEPFAIDDGQVPTMDELMPDDREQVTMEEFWFEIDNQDGAKDAKADWQREDYSYLKEIV